MKESRAGGWSDLKKSCLAILLVCMMATKPSVSYAEGFGAAFANYLSGERDIALQEMRALADEGNIDALIFLAEDAQRQFNLVEATSLASELYERAATQGSGHAQRRLGDLYDQRARNTQDANEQLALFEEAARWYRQAADQGIAPAAYALARYAENGTVGPSDADEALAFYTQAAEANHAEAARELGILLIRQGSFEAAEQRLLIAAEANDAAAQLILSDMYRLGLGVEQNDDVSSMWLERAANAGDHSAQRSLAVNYWSGIGAPRDRETSVSMLRSAADSGNTLAQLDLGWMYYRGIEVPLDYGLAREFFSMAANSGSAEAQYRLATMVMFAQGGRDLGVTENYRQAMELFRTSAEQGYLPAQLELARLYENGVANFRDDVEALRWYRAAAERGNAEAAEAVASMLSEGRGVPHFQDGPVHHFGHLPNVLFLVGPIDESDGTTTIDAIDRFEPDLVILHSPGGNVGEAMEIAETIFLREISTYVPPIAQCLSACVYLFGAGANRYSYGAIGVHQLQTANENAAVPIAELQIVIAEIISALNRYEVPSFVVERSLQSSDMYFLSPDELESFSREGSPLVDYIDVRLIDALLAYQFDMSDDDFETFIDRDR